MMIFMMANTAGCFVTSVVLNVVDHRQVSNEVASQTESMFVVLIEMVWFIFILVQGGTLNKTTKRPKHGEGEALKRVSSSSGMLRWIAVQ